MWLKEMPKKDPLILCLLSSNRNILAERKYQNRTTFKVRTTELYFETIEANQDPEKLTNFELEYGLFSW